MAVLSAQLWRDKHTTFYNLLTCHFIRGFYLYLNRHSLVLNRLIYSLASALQKAYNDVCIFNILTTILLDSY